MADILRTPPVGSITVTGQLLSTAKGAKLTQYGDLVLDQSTGPSARLTQYGDLVLDQSTGPSARLTQYGVLVLWQEQPRTPPSGAITLTGQAPSVFSPVTITLSSGQIVLVGQAPNALPGSASAPASGLIELIGQAPTLAFGFTVSPPSGLITLAGQAPVVSTGAATGVRLTQYGELVLDQSTGPSARLTQAGELVLDQATAVAALLTQYGELVLDQRPDVSARLSQYGILVLCETLPEVAPEIGSNFGPLVWVEWTGPDGSVPVWAPVDLPDPSGYYRGYKSPKLLRAGTVQRALSDEMGEIQNQRFEVEIDDSDTTLRTLLGQSDMRRNLVNTTLVVRMISDEDRRRQLTPRTVAIGVVRSYTLS